MQTDLTQFVAVVVIMVVFLAALFIVDRKKVKDE
jgi:hypothetical protein